MADPALVPASFAVLAAAALYAYVGVLTLRRPGSADARLAIQLFAVWWFGLAGTTAIGGVRGLLGFAGLTGLGLFATLTYLNMVLYMGAIGGLVYYFLYLFTGRRGLVVPVGAIYLVGLVGAIYFIAASAPAAVEVGRFQARLVYANPLSQEAAAPLLLLLLVPALGGTAAYLSLALREREATQRYRILLVSTGIIVWFLSSTALALSGRFFADEAWQFGWRFVGLVAALLTYLAYRPPARVRRRWGIRAVGEGA